jgi:hypothetical protein
MQKKESLIAEYEALMKAIGELNSMKPGDDPEIAHGRAEEILCEYLTAIGAKELANAFDEAVGRVGFWYA